MKFWWPIGLIVCCSTAYQVGVKEISTGIHPLAALVLTYLSASFASFLLYFFLAPKGENRRKALLSWNPWALGLGCSIVGIELGVVYMYRAGWTVPWQGLPALCGSRTESWAAFYHAAKPSPPPFEPVEPFFTILLRSLS